MAAVAMGRLGDGFAAGTRRVLVDRLWPRGVRKDAGLFDEWCPEVAPSTALRRWYGHDPARFEEFARRYRAELEALDGHPTLVHLRALAEGGRLALLTASRDVARSQVPVLRAFLLAPLPGPEGKG
ncbi:MAG: DUF488 family protein [Firmicutes bacterium]|nr:DUF488 family protein [Alicyclobacillaceae bacterium]MCL6496287.1 DUF488 family protein [Bacillota bacterium]